MEFRLTYSGKLKSKSSTKAKVTQELRRAFHPQLKVLWDQVPLSDVKNYVKPGQPESRDDGLLVTQIGEFHFASLVSDRWSMIAEIDILFLRPSPPGALVGHGGDLDNRIKTLMDGLRVPSQSEIPKGDKPGEGELPFFCLLQDDALVTSLAVRTDRLLQLRSESEVELVIHVNAKPTRRVWGNIGL